MSLRAGDWIEVRSKEEILRSLDEHGRLDNLPFMPQMFEYCGRKFQVFKRAHKTCDTVNYTGGRSLPEGIHLDLRCNGQAYGGCQAACLIFWKEAWLKPIGDAPWAEVDELQTAIMDLRAGCSEEAVLAGTLAMDQPTVGGPKYSCQATDLPLFTKHLPWWRAMQYVEDYTSRNATMSRLISGFLYASFYSLRPADSRNSLGRPLRWLYDRLMAVLGGIPFPRRRGLIPVGEKTPNSTLDLQPGEWVRVKSYKEILATIDANNNNKGLFFDAEMVPFCGRTFRVKSRVTQFIGEKTGLMVTLRTPAIILENVWCQSRFSDRRMLCPRAIYSWWRETWLERVTPEILSEADRVGKPQTTETV